MSYGLMDVSFLFLSFHLPKLELEEGECKSIFIAFPSWNLRKES